MLTAKDVMSSEVISIGLDSTVGEAAELLVRHGISAVPVVDKGRFVSRQNILTTMHIMNQETRP